MQTRRIGDLDVSAIGLGGMPLSRTGRSGSLPDRDQALATVHTALDLGITLIDTADCYAPDDHNPIEGGLGHNEELIAEALRGRGEEVLVATKGGIQRNGGEWPTNGTPEWIHRAVRGSLRRLGVESIGLYQHHRPDPTVPYAETIGAFKELYDDGLVQRVGLSNADPDQIRTAHGILGGALVSVQNQFSPGFRSSEPELRLCEELGLAFLPWSPLGGMRHAADLGEELVAFAEVAAAHQVSPQQVCLAWMLALSPVVVPIPGASRPASIADSAAAVHLTLSDEDLARLEAR
ncbi:aldo/keto reductase [Nocardioides sp.]|uniref:aldo/keto reductase n=1 Tax=Nocardioides sp. TaxID=35761 RepID=UPI002733800B|nr:aldo/keto reductase [Nocardioides sp.]MDP3890809.1 aldo/keto reductase [Nocardioides sp.]